MADTSTDLENDLTTEPDSGPESGAKAVSDSEPDSVSDSVSDSEPDSELETEPLVDPEVITENNEDTPPPPDEPDLATGDVETAVADDKNAEDESAEAEEPGNIPDEPEPPQEAPQEPAPDTPPDHTPPSTLNNRYDIYPGRPLPEMDSPSARAYVAEDRMQPQLKLFALICIPGLPVRWEEMETIVGNLLPGNMSLAAFGNITWPILEQNCLTLIFERPLGGRIDQFLKDPVQPEYKKIYTIRLVAETGIKSLLSLKEHHLTNRNIRTDNIFFANNDHEEVVFGEFVSSPPGFDQPVIFETIERGTASEGGRGAGAIEDDIYALGVTLALLLQQKNPVRGKSREQIILAKISGNSFQTLVGKVLLTATLLEPMRGMLNDNVEERWGFDELDMWLTGRRVTPHQVDAAKKAQRPFKFGDFEHTIPRTFAFSMNEHRESALKLIKDGTLEQWFARNLEDTEKAALIATAVEVSQALEATEPDADELLLSRILMIMDPRAPISYKGINYMPDGFGSVIAVELLRGGNIKTYAESIVKNVPNIWFETAKIPAADQFTGLESFARISGYLQKAGPGFGIERCLYEGNPGYACQSAFIAKENVLSIGMLLPTLNDIEKSADTKKSPVDRHVAAFIAARSEDNMDNHLVELGDLDDTIRTLGMLRLLVLLQDRMSVGTLMGLTKWVGGLMGPVIRLYHSRSTRKEVKGNVPRIVRKGDLSELLTLLDDPIIKQEDETNYLAALEEFANAEEEITNTDLTSGPGSEAAERTSKQVAAITSILVMIFIVSIIIMAG